MGLEKVVEDILRRGEEKSKEIVRTGEKERDDQIRAAQKKVEENKKRSQEGTDARIVQMEQQELSSAELESKRELLMAEKAVMEELRGQVLDELGQYPADKRRRLYAKLVDRAKKELGKCVVYSSKVDSTLLKLPSGMSMGEPIDCVGGLVFESDDKTVRLDFRFESVLEDVWNKKMKEIFTELFG